MLLTCRYRILVILVLVLISTQVRAQSVRMLSADNDLSNSLVSAIYQDVKGYMWIGTENGLSRYDGTEIKTYHHELGNKLSLRGNSVQSLMDDGHGRLLVGSNEGLQMYDYGTDKFYNISLKVKGMGEIPWSVRNIVRGKDGNFYMSTSGAGLLKVSYVGGRPKIRRVAMRMYDHNIRQIAFDSKNRLWLLSDAGIVYRAVNEMTAERAVSCEDGKKFVQINYLFCSTSGRLYAGATSQGLFVYDEGKDAFVKLPLKVNMPVMDMVQTDATHVLIATDGEGVKVLDMSANVLTDYNMNSNVYDGRRDKVHVLFKDREDNLWIGAYQKGVYICPDRTYNFHFIAPEVGFRKVKDNAYVSAVCRDQSGNLWVGTDNNGLYMYDRVGRLKQHFVHSDGDSHSVPNAIISLYCDSKGELWVGSFLDEMSLYCGRGFMRMSEMLPEKQANYYRHVFGICEDHHHNLWMATIGYGLWRMNIESRKTKHFMDTPTSLRNKRENALHSPFLSSITVDKDDKVFYSTVNGIGCYDQRNNSFLSAFGINHVGDNCVVCLLADGDRMWMGCPYGLQCYSMATKKITTFTTDNGLPDNSVISITMDRKRHLWLGTFNGLSMYDQQKNTFANFYYNDGLQGNEYSRNVVYSADDGHLFFGGVNGVSYFNPDEIVARHKAIKIEISKMTIGSNNVTTETQSDGSYVIDRPITDIDHVKLSYKDATFSIGFTSFAYINPDQICYYYQIDGEKWIKLPKGNNLVSFSSMSPGRYVLNVRAKGNNITSDVKTIKIIISPPWYATWWALCIYLIIVATAVRFFFLHNKIKHEQEMDEAKINFFMNISHEIRTPLTLIIDPIDKLIHSDKDMERQKTYGIVRRNSQRILQLISQLMDLRKIEKGQMKLHIKRIDMVSFLANLYDLFEYRAHQKNIRFNFEHTDRQLYVNVDPANFDKIVMNILSNAFKFTPREGTITMKLESYGSGVTLSVADTGIGIEDKNKEKIFRRFFQATHSAEMTMGTGIGLNLTKQLVELHHGDIHVEDNPDHQGSVFIVHFPMESAIPEEETEQNDDMDEEIAFERNLLVKNVDVDDDNKKRKFAPARKKILIVEDDDEIRTYLEQQLASSYRVLLASNGKQGWNIITSDKPDIIISDVMMPVMDGFELCRNIKRNIKTNDIPVIMLTAKTGVESTVEGLNIGADAYISKPFSLDILLSSIQNLIRMRDILKNKFTGNEEQGDKVKQIQLKSTDQQLMDRILKVINDEISNSDLTIDTICQEVGISRVHLNRKLKELTNQTTHDFIKNIRIKQAARLLASEHQNITDVANAVGFSSLVTFNRAFNDTYNMSPKEYRDHVTKL